MLQWVEKVWKPFVADKPQSLLMLDAFKVHLMGSVVKELSECGTFVEFLPAGETSKVQVGLLL